MRTDMPAVATTLHAYAHPSTQAYVDSWGTTTKTLTQQFGPYYGSTGDVEINTVYPYTQSSGFTIYEIAQ